MRTYIISPEVTVTVEDYILTLNVNATTCIVGETLNFSGTLTTNSYVIVDAKVTLWCDGTDTGLWTLTDGQGYYEILYTTTTAATSTFYTNVTITE